MQEIVKIEKGLGDEAVHCECLNNKLNFPLMQARLCGDSWKFYLSNFGSQLRFLCTFETY